MHCVIRLGLIRERLWYGPGGMEHLRTTKKPEQSIPTFAETVTLLMKVCPRFFLARGTIRSLSNACLSAREPTCQVQR